MVGYYTEQLNDLEIKLEELKEEKNGKLESVNQIKSFLSEFGYDSKKQLQQEIELNETELEKTQSKLKEIRGGTSVPLIL